MGHALLRLQQTKEERVLPTHKPTISGCIRIYLGREDTQGGSEGSPGMLR